MVGFEIHTRGKKAAGLITIWGARARTDKRAHASMCVGLSGGERGGGGGGA